MQTPEQIVADWLEMPITENMGSELNELIAAISAYGSARAAAERMEIRLLLEAIADYLYNPFEPDNQSPMYERVRAALVQLTPL